MMKCDHDLRLNQICAVVRHDIVSQEGLIVTWYESCTLVRLWTCAQKKRYSVLSEWTSVSQVTTVLLW